MGLEEELSALLEVERFEPPAEFRERALLTDPAVYERGGGRPRGLVDCARRPSCSTGSSEPSQGARRLQPALLQVVRGRQAERLGQLPRPPRRGRASASASPTTGAARRARSATSPTPTCTRRAALRQRAARTCGVEKGDVVGIYLPMIPEVVVAMLACARIGAVHNVVFGGFSAESVRERMEFSEAKALVTVDGARRKGKTAPIKQAVDEHMGDLETLETIVVVRHTGIECPMTRGPRRLLRRGAGGGRPGVPGRAARRRAPALHPLHLRLDREAEGDPAHDRRLHDRRHRDPPLRLRPQARVRRLLVRRRRRLGHRPLLHRLRAALQRRHQRDVGGGARLPAQGDLVGAGRALQGDDPLRGADRDPHLHQVGRGDPGRVTTSPRCGCWARSASRSTPRPGSGTTR